MITKKEFSQALTDNASVAAGLIPLATAENDGLMPKGLCSYNKYTANSNKFIEIKLKYDGTPRYIDCFIGFSKDHEDVFVLCALHLYTSSSRQNAYIKLIVEKNIKGYNFYMLKGQDNSISIILQNSNTYFSTFLTPIHACRFTTPEFKELDALPEGAKLIETVQ